MWMRLGKGIVYWTRVVEVIYLHPCSVKMCRYVKKLVPILDAGECQVSEAGLRCQKHIPQTARPICTPQIVTPPGRIYLTAHFMHMYFDHNPCRISFHRLSFAPHSIAVSVFVNIGWVGQILRRLRRPLPRWRRYVIGAWKLRFLIDQPSPVSK